jgi:DNA repair protein RadC
MHFACDSRPRGIPWMAARRDPEKYARVMAASRAIGRISGPQMVYAVLGPVSDRRDRESMWVLALDIYGYLRGVEEVARGERDQVGIDLPDVWQSTIAAGSRYPILAHNHPSGDANPSTEDARLTRDAAQSASCSGLVLVDHCVLGLGQVFSFRENALWKVTQRPPQ